MFQPSNKNRTFILWVLADDVGTEVPDWVLSVKVRSIDMKSGLLLQLR